MAGAGAGRLACGCRRNRIKLREHKNKTEGRNTLTRQQGGLETAAVRTRSDRDIQPLATQRLSRKHRSALWANSARVWSWRSAKLSTPSRLKQRSGWPNACWGAGNFVAVRSLGAGKQQVRASDRSRAGSFGAGAGSRRPNRGRVRGRQPALAPFRSNVARVF